MADPVESLERVAFLLERARASTYRVRAFRRAAQQLAELTPGEIRRRAEAGTLTELPGIGDVTAGVAGEAVRGEYPAYLRELEAAAREPLVAGGESLLAAVRGDLHTHSDWSDGGSPVDVMAGTAAALGREYIALTDHSPRLRVARGLTPERLRRQLDVVADLNARPAPLRVLTGIEVDILEDGTLDQEPELLDRLDVVVASVHSKLAMGADAMTRRMVLAVANPRTDVLGHCTGRMVTGEGRTHKTRPESTFDAEMVFEACREYDVAVEINCRPERLDPPMRLLALARDMGCLFALDTDAHAPGQLDWLAYGASRAERAGIPQERIVTTWGVDRLLDWTRS